MKKACETAAMAGLLLLAGCLPSFGTPNYPSRQKVIDVAASCGIEGFEPTVVDAGIAAYVDPSVQDAQVKEDCIYDRLHSEGYIVTR